MSDFRVQCLVIELEPLCKIFLLSIKLAMTGYQDTDDDSMDSTGIFAIDADGEDFEDDTYDDSSDSYDNDFDPFH